MDGSTEGRSRKDRRIEGASTEDRGTEGRDSEGRSAEGRSAEGRSSEGRSAEGRSSEGRGAEGRSAEGRSAEGRSTEGRSSEDRGTESGNQIWGKRVALAPECMGNYALPLSALFDELLACSLDTGICRVIFYTEGRPGLSENRAMGDFQSFAWKYIHPEECRQFLAFFQTERLKELCGTGRANRMTFRRRVPGAGYVWVEALAVPSGEEGIVLFYVRGLDREEQENRVLKQIVDRYVYRDCDYLLCLDADSGSCDVLCGNDSQAPTLQQGGGNSSRKPGAADGLWVEPEDRDMYLEKTSMEHVLDVLDRDGELTVAYGTRDTNGGYRRKELRYTYFDKPGRKILLLCKDITDEYTEKRRQKKRLRDALLHARIDSLTGLYNRQAVNARINRILEGSLAPASALLFMDLDNFKTVNDTLGHRYGDKVLCHVAECFRRTLRPGDMIGRVGGDEFVAFLAGITSREEAEQCAEHLCRAVSRIPDLEEQGLKLSCSIGGATCPGDGRDYETLLQKADVAVYEAKRRGRNRYAFYDTGMEEHVCISPGGNE